MLKSPLVHSSGDFCIRLKMASSYGCSSGKAIFDGDYKRMAGSPYLDYATQAVPASITEIINWSEYVMTLTDELGDGLRKLYAAFLTPIKILGFTDKLQTVDLNNIEKFRLLILNKLNYYGEAQEVGLNTVTYGNDFVSMQLKHQRSLVCKSCYHTYVLKPSEMIKELSPKFTADGFVGACINKRCPNHRQYRLMAVNDTHDRSEAGVLCTHWKFRDLEFDYREARRQLQVYYRVPNHLKVLIRANDIMTLHDYDIGIMEAAVTDKLFLFNEDALFHAKHSTISGLELGGLGLPRTLIHARPHWLLQLLNKQCQVLARDYLRPIPYFTSSGIGAGSGGMPDPTYSGGNHAQMSSMVTEMVADSRVDPGNYYYIPGNLEFRYAAGHADQFVPDKLLSFATDKLTNGLLPMALMKGQITHEMAPFWLKFFESLNRDIPMLYDRFLWWFCERVASLLSVESVNFQHTPFSIENNIANQSQLASAVSMGAVSKSAWLDTMNLNPRFEAARSLDEFRTSLEVEATMASIQELEGLDSQIGQLAGQSVMTAIQGPQAAGQPATGQPAAGQPADPNAAAIVRSPNSVVMPSQGYVPPKDGVVMAADAAVLASMLGEVDDHTRRRELQILRSNSPGMHAMVTTELKKLRDQVAMDARKQMAPTL